MSLIATAADFEQAGQGALYSPAYQEYLYFQLRIDKLKGRAAPNNQKLAVWGCAWGYLVNLAVAAGYDAFGFDASAYAIAKAKALFPALAARFFQRNALVSGDVSGSRGDAGIHGQSKFALLVTEDMLTCMSDAEINTSLPLLRGACSANLLHVLSPSDEGTPVDQRINWKTKEQWAALLEPPDVCVDPNGVQF